MPALEAAPLVGPLGELVINHVSAQAWGEWVEMQIKIINETRLDLSEEKAQNRLYEQMIEYLNLNNIGE